MAILAPSLLSADFSHLEQDCRSALKGGAKWFHYDVMDGHFVPNLSFGVPVLKSIHKALPDAFYDVHLMLTDPADYVAAFAEAGASLINFHVESHSGAWETLDAIRAAGCRTGMTVKPGTPVQAVFPYLEQLDLVLVMSVEPGFGGQSFMADMLDKVRQLSAERERRGLHYLIEIDGGINLDTGAQAVDAGADVLVAGSTAFAVPDVRSACAALSRL